MKAMFSRSVWLAKSLLRLAQTAPAGGAAEPPPEHAPISKSQKMEKTIWIGENLYTLASDDAYLDTMGDKFEPHMVQLFKCLIKPNDVVADVGGNIGMTAILFSGLARKVYAFEPSPSTFAILKTNLSRAQTSNVEAVNLGLGERSEKLTITFAANNRSGGFISDKLSLKNHVTEEVQIESLDHFFSRAADRPDFIKIDVEGYEGSVIRGAYDTIKAKRPLVTLELNHFCLNVLRRITVPDFLDFLRSVFPFLYAVDTDNTTIADLHDEEWSYRVMHEHLTRFRFPNLVGGFDPALTATLKELELSARAALCIRQPLVVTPRVINAAGGLRVIAPPRSVRCMERFSLQVEVSNNSNCDWSGSGDCPVYLSYHWQDQDGKIMVFDGERSALKNGDVHAKEIAPTTMQVVAPASGGDLH